jgi:hypothetical protein
LAGPALHERCPVRDEFDLDDGVVEPVRL